MHRRQVGMGAFGAQDDALAVAARLQPAPKGALAGAAFDGQPVGIHFGRIEEVAALVDECVEQGKGLIAAQAAAQPAGAQADGPRLADR